jgi:hypothetical protein
VSFIAKKEESPIVVPLLVSEDKETKSEERSPFPSLRYPTSSSSSSRASSRLSSYCTCLPALRYLPVRRGDCYSPYSFSSRVSVLVLTSYSSSVGTIFLRLVSLYVPRRVHFLFPFPLVTDLTPFSELPTGRGLVRSSLLTFLADVSCPISRTFLSPKPILLYRLVIHLTHTIP